MIKHLTEEEIAICAEALERNDYHSLPNSMRQHLFECDQCADEVLMVADVAGDINFKVSEPKSTGEKTQRIIAWSVSVAAAAALILLVIDLNFSSDPERGGQETFITQNNEDEDSRKPEEQTTKEKEETLDIESTREKEKESFIADNKATKDQTSTDKNITSEPMPGAEGPATSALPPLQKEAADTLKLLAHMLPDEELEKLVTRFEGNLRDDSTVSVISPLTITSSNSHIIIKWNNPEKKRLIIEVFDNEGNRILEDETNDEQYTIENLSDGLYYWKLISANFDLLFCGRIVVE